jgi:prepilin-type N-terminal cleavage/methylation domain-containing protein
MLTRLKSSAGYTLTEVVVVIGLLGVLGAIAVPNFIDLRDDAKISLTKDELAMLKRGIVGDGRVIAGGTYAFPGYEADMGAPPGALNSLALNPATGDTTVTYDPITRTGWRGPYVDTSTVSNYASDAWGRAYVFATSPRYIRSKGTDGADNSGTGDDLQVNW